MAYQKQRSSWGVRIVLAGLVAFLILCSLTATFGAGDLLLSLGKHLVAWAETRHWQPVPMRIDSVALAYKRIGHHSYVHGVEVSYSYQIGTTQYHGNRAWLLTEYDHLQGVHQVLVNQLKESQKTGQPFSGYVDPQDPTRSLLDRSFRGIWWISTFGMVLIFGGMGLAIPLLGIYTIRESRRSDALKLKHPREPWLWDTPTAEGRIRPRRRWILPTLVFVGFATVATPSMFDVWLTGEPIEFGFEVMMVSFPIATVAAAIDVALHTWHWRRYGAPSLRVVNWPLRIGKRAQFLLKWERASAPRGPLYVVLSIATREENPSVTFRTEVIVPMASDGQWQWEFELPSDQPPSRNSAPDRPEVAPDWSLKITESSNWLKSRCGFQAEYNLPVFR